MTAARAKISALPYVEGQSHRFTAAPTKLTPLAGKVMLASGALSTPRRVARFPMIRTGGMMVLVALACFIVSGPNNVQTQQAERTGSQAPAAATVCVVDQQKAMATERGPTTRAELPDLAPAAGDAERQDRFEIERFTRPSFAARHEEILQHRSGNRSTGVSAR